MQTYNDYILASNNALLDSQKLAQNAENIKMREVKNDKSMKAWTDYIFESSSALTPEFSLFARQLKNYIKKNIAPLQLVSFLRGHFYCSGFVRNPVNGKYAYFSIPDVRHFKNEWHNNLLIRTAKNDKDYAGGSNSYCNLPGLAEKLRLLAE